MDRQRQPPRHSLGAAKGAPELLPTDSAGQMGLAVAANGSKIAYSALMMMPERAEWRIRDLASGREDSLPLTFSPASGAPRLSPDGSKIAYRNFIGGKTVYYLAHTSGGGGTQICENCRIMGFFSMALIFWWLRASN